MSARLSEFIHKSCACQSHQLPVRLSPTPLFCKNCRGHTLAKSLDLQIMQRDLQQLPHNLPCSVSLCRKSSIFITPSPSRRSIVLRHLPCSIPICVTTSRSEMERGMSNRNAGKFPLIEKVLAGSCLVTVGVYTLSESAFTLTRIIH